MGKRSGNHIWSGPRVRDAAECLQRASPSFPKAVKGRSKHMVKIPVLLAFSWLCASSVVAQSVTWGGQAVSPWSREAGVVRVVTADPLAHQLAGLQRHIGLWMMQELRSLLAAIELGEGADQQLKSVIDAARSDLPMSQFHDLLMRTRWLRLPAGLSLSSDAAQALTVWLDAAEALWGDPVHGGYGWLHRLAHGAAGGDAEFEECLVPRVADPLAYRYHLEVPEFLRRPAESALRDPASALRAVNELAHHCHARGATTGARGATWSCIAAMSSRAWESLAEPYPGLLAVRAEGVLSITLLVRISEREGLVNSVPGGRSAAPRPDMVVVITDDEFEALDTWRTALEDVALVWERGGHASSRWIEAVRITLGCTKDLSAAARTVRAGGSGDSRDEGFDDAVRGLENGQFSYSGRLIRAVEGAIADPRYWPDELGGSWVAMDAIALPVHSFRLPAGNGRDRWSGGAPRFFFRNADGTRTDLWGGGVAERSARESGR